jgi:hypothetical protein
MPLFKGDFFAHEHVQCWEITWKARAGHSTKKKSAKLDPSSHQSHFLGSIRTSPRRFLHAF